MNDWFAARRQRMLRLKVRREGERPFAPRLSAAEPVFEQCPRCHAAVTRTQWDKNRMVCPECGFHRPVGAYRRLSVVLDEGTFQELDPDIAGADPLNFPGYGEKLAGLRRRTGLREAAVTARGRIGGMPVIAAVLDSRFLMGSMGVAVGEKIARAAEAAEKARMPLVIFCASGGARMQEGILSLMQMGKTAAAVTRFREKGGLYIAYLTHPTTGGVTASFAMLGDITLAEPEALIGFAGPRVIEQTIGQTLPEGFQRAEYLQEHGFVDAVVPRAEMRNTLAKLLRLHQKGGVRRDAE